ncbi:uncharacterized protein LOC113925434 [Zalophus californianus]|uniref:Uncharacterized protein LOC113925434 n=1 Tax=Zalophus californianus TaxID=9704 RepID=A0A6J2DNQ7_ZALCA|nr:uncharacterized protein LOC113925434 [Zalophus californianus]
MYSYIFRAARVNICRNRGKKISRQPRAIFVRVREWGARAKAAGGGPQPPPPPAKGRLGAGLVSSPRRPAGAAGGHQPRRRPWAISKRRHLDSSNLWCGRYRCSPGLTSLFEGADHSRGSTTETSPPLPSGGLRFPSLHLLLTPERQTSDWPRPSLNAASSRKPFQRLELVEEVDGSLGNRPSSPSPRENQETPPRDGSRWQWVSVNRPWLREWKTQPGPGLPRWPLSTT